LAVVGGRRRHATTRDPQKIDMVCGLVAAIVACWVLALGPWLSWNDELTGIKLPAYVLTHAVPGLSGIRAWSRFGIGVIFGLAPLASLGLSRLTERGGHVVRAAASVAALSVLAIEYQHVPIPIVAAPPRATPAHVWLAGHAHGQPLMILPTGLVHPCTHARYMLQTTLHWLPLASGYSGYPPPMMFNVNRIGLGLPDEQALRGARRRGIRWLLVELDALTAEQRAAFERAEDEGRLVPIARFDRELVYDLDVGKRGRPRTAPARRPPAERRAEHRRRRLFRSTTGVSSSLDPPTPSDVQVSHERTVDELARVMPGSSVGPTVHLCGTRKMPHVGRSLCTLSL
jgi:hypothetical protein